jgi:hypothetical protein
MEEKFMKQAKAKLFIVVVSIFLLAAVGCRNEPVSPGDVKAITLTWVPNKTLRNSRMEMKLDQAIADIFVEKMALSREIDSVWVAKLALIEGSYEITLVKKDGTSAFYTFGGDSILYSPTDKKFYQNKDLHLFIYQILLRECAQRNIKLQ